MVTTAYLIRGNRVDQIPRYVAMADQPGSIRAGCGFGGYGYVQTASFDLSSAMHPSGAGCLPILHMNRLDQPFVSMVNSMK